MTSRRLVPLALVSLLAAACGEAPAARAEPVTTTTVETPAPPPAAAPTAAARPLDTKPYPWHHDATLEPLVAVDTLEARFAPPPGFTRVDVAPRSFGAWLRTLPLAAVGSPVLAYDGRVVLPRGHHHLAAVSTVDIGKRDLQQCVDAVMRLHAEWLWSRGLQARASYPSGGGAISWRRHLAGDVPVPRGAKLGWRRRGAQPRTHASYRRYLDNVFAWSNTTSVARHAPRAKRADLRPGDFFVLPGGPGHAVLVLDIARHADGRLVALIGQSFMPAQNFQVLRPSRHAVWFELTDEGVDTPFWQRFPWSALRRFDPS